MVDDSTERNVITHFSVKNYKCLADVSLPLTKLHVIIGQNDTGKTSLFEAIHASFATIERLDSDWTEFGQAFAGTWNGRELVWNQSLLPICSVDMKFGIEAARTLELSHLAMAWQFEKTIITKNSEDKQQKSLDVGLSSISVDGSKLVITQDVKVKLDGLARRYRSAKISPILRFFTSEMSTPCELVNPPRQSLDGNGYGLPSLLDAIKDYDVQQFLAIEKRFRTYFPIYKKIRLETASLRNEAATGIRAQFPVQHVGKQIILSTLSGDVRLQQVSDGAVLLLGFLALMHSPTPPSVLLIEEPENGIHPKRLIEVAKLLREFTEREQNAPQIILTTHSPLLLSEFKPEEVTLMRRMPDGSAKAYPLRDAKHIHERMQDKSQLGELWYYLSEDELLL